MSKPPPAGQPRPNFPPITPPPPAGPRTDPPPPGPKTNQLEVAVSDTVARAVQALALLALGVFFLVVSFIGPAESEPRVDHQRPLTSDESLHRQGDRLMDDLTRAYQEGQR